MTATEVRPAGPTSGAAEPADAAEHEVASDHAVHQAGDLLAPPTAVPERRFSLLHVGHLPAAVRESRHRMLIAILAVHVPFVLLLGIDQHHGAPASAELMVPTLLAVLAARFLHGRTLRSAAVVAGLCWSSYAVVYLSGGAAEAKLHPLLVLVLVALYQEPALLLGAVVALVAALAVPSALDPSLVYAAGPARDHAWRWTGVNALAALGVAAAAAFSWRRDVPVPVFADPAPVALVEEDEPDPEVAEHIERARAAELALARRQATYALMTNLARRNQSLVGRQLSTLDDLERDERDPDVLAGLFALDHLATRMRRNAENLLVLAGAGGAAGRSFSQPVPVEELLRGAAAEVEQYARVDVHVGADAAIAGHAVSDVAHLLAELLDNALACSPPDTQVVVGAAPGTEGGLRLWVADEGIGMTAARLAEFNALLSDTEDEVEVGATLGFPVVKRLAARHDIDVVLGSREGGQPGLVAYVDLPADIVRSDAPGAPSSVVVPSAAGAALPGRRAARRVTEDLGKLRRNELALDAAAENWFHPAPIPTAGEVDEEESWAWGTPAEPEPAAPAAAPASGLPTREAGGSPMARRTDGGSPSAQRTSGGLPQRPVSAPPSAAAAEEPVTTPLDLAALRASVGSADPEPSAAAEAAAVFTPEPTDVFTPEPAAVFTPEPAAEAAEAAAHSASDRADELGQPSAAADAWTTADTDGPAESDERGTALDLPATNTVPEPAALEPVEPPVLTADDSADDSADEPTADADLHQLGGPAAAAIAPAAAAADELLADVEDADAFEAPTGGAYDDILFGSAPLPADEDLPPLAPAELADLEPVAVLADHAAVDTADDAADDTGDHGTVPARDHAAVPAQDHPTDAVLPWAGETAAPVVDTVVPTQPTRGGLARRVPQQALREAGGFPAPQVFQPGPAFGAAPGGDADPAERTAPPDPGRASGVLSSYRAGLQRARAAQPENTASQNTAPQNTAPQNTAPQNTAPQNTAPNGADA